MDQTQVDTRVRSSGSTFMSNQPSLSQHSESNAAYFSWSTSSSQERRNYFENLHKRVSPKYIGTLPKEHQAKTLLDLMTIRAFHSNILRCCSLGTAIGFRIRKGVLTNIPAIIVFVSRKVHMQWLTPIQCLPTILEGPGGVWCDVDVVEFSYFGTSEQTTKEQLYMDTVDDLRGSGSSIGSGSQVASQETYGTLGAIVRSQTGNREVGFLTNLHVAVDIGYPTQKMFHPLPPTLGPGIYLGAVERANSFIPDDLWYGIFAGVHPDTCVRVDGAFIRYSKDFDLSTVTTSVKDVGEIGDLKRIDLQSPINSIIGQKVMKVGCSSGLTKGIVLVYALEYNNENGFRFYNDFLVVGENQDPFDLEGDSGSLIFLKGENREKPRPIGIISGGTTNRGRLKLKVGQPPENWTSGVDLGRLLNLLELDLITTADALNDAVREQVAASGTVVGSTGTNLSRPEIELPKDKVEPLGLHIQQHIPSENGPGTGVGDHDINMSPTKNAANLEDMANLGPSIKHQFIPSFNGHSRLHINEPQCRAESENLCALKRMSSEDLGFGLHLGENEPKRRRSDFLSPSMEHEEAK
uniref:protein NARROW LEAF 1-like n=1 Tax=Erigeron canadensis TaxID=72917 RepID=UPI001CB96E90|nr:protein NARROW LEAF 1-like [Erigeron canadensis]